MGCTFLMELLEVGGNGCSMVDFSGSETGSTGAVKRQLVVELN